MADSSKVLEIVIQAKDEASKVLEGMGGRLDKLSQRVTDAGILLAGIGASTALMAKGFVNAAGKMEATKTAFNVLIGDAELAEKTLQQLYDLESKTPFTLESIMTESKKLLAMGTDAEDLTGTLTMLGDVASGVGFEKLPQLTLAFGQIQAKGRLMGTELRQLTESGFNLADAMGISSAKLDEMIANKEVGFEDVKKAFEKVTGEGGRFHGMMNELSKTTPGMISTMESSIFKLNAAFGEALLPTVNKILTALIPLAEGFASFAKENPKLVLGLVSLGLGLGVLGTFMLALVTIVPKLYSSFLLLKAGAVFMGNVVMGIVGILGGPLTIAIGLIIGIIALLAIAWNKNWGDIQGKTEKAMKAIGDGLKWLGIVFDGFKKLIINGDFVGSLGRALGMDEDSPLFSGILAVRSALISFITFITSIPSMISSFGSAIYDFFTVTIPKAIQDAITWFDLLPARIKAGIYQAFVIDIPMAVGFAIGFLTEAVPRLIDFIILWFSMLPTRINEFFTLMWLNTQIIFWNFIASASAFAQQVYDNIVNWLSLLPGRLLAIFTQAYVFVTTKLTETWAWINKELSQWSVRIENFLKNLPGKILAILNELKNAFTNKLDEMWNTIVGWKDKVVGAFNAVSDAVGRAISAIKEGFKAGQSAGKSFSFQHGGFVPGAYDQAVPAVLHGGERVVPRIGTDVNTGGGGGGIALTLNFSGAVNMDSDSRVQELADKIINIIGRQNELASKGLAI